MKLDAWLRQRHPPEERLRLIERLSQALNAVHDRGEALASLVPSGIEVGNGLLCDLSAAARGAPETGYAAPERLEGDPPSPEADIYSAGAIAWEVLAGRPCGEQPASLAEVAPEVPKELGDAVMGCLERSPQWRPKDLTYLAQLAAAQQKTGRRDAPAPTPMRGAPARQGARAARTPPPRTSRSHWTVILAAVLLLVLAGLGYRMMRGEGPGDAPRAARSAPAKPGPTPATPRQLSPDPATAMRAGLTPTPAAAAIATPAATPTPRPTPTPSIPQPPIAAAAAARPTPVPAPTPTPQPTPTPTPTPAPVRPAAPPATAAAPAPVAPPAAREPVVLSSVSPVTMRRPGRAMIDLHGSGLRSDLVVRVRAMREMPRGITVAGQKCVSANLMTALLELDESVKPATYAIALEDPTGGPLKMLPFTVTK